MSKYIDADKLIAEIKRQIEETKSMKPSFDQFWAGQISAFKGAIKIAESLQQEPRFPQYDNIVEKVFGAGNLEGWERDEAEILVALAKEELLKSLQQEQPEPPTCKSCGFYENNCPFIRDKFIPYPNRVCKDYTYSVMKEQPKEDIEKEYAEFVEADPVYSKLVNGIVGKAIARHFYELGINARKK